MLLKDEVENKHLIFLKNRMKANKIYLHKCYQVVSHQKFLYLHLINLIL